MTQDRAAEIAANHCETYDTDDELATAIRRAITAAREEGRKAGLEEAAEFVTGVPESRHKIREAILAAKERAP